MKHHFRRYWGSLVEMASYIFEGFEERLGRLSSVEVGDAVDIVFDGTVEDK